jgi:hydrogenase-4 component E
MELIIILGLLASAFAMVFSKRLSTLIGNFSMQSFFLSLFSFVEAIKGGHIELYLIAVLVFVLKVVVIPRILLNIVEEIKANENLGFFINPQLSLVVALALTYCSWLFSGMIFVNQGVLVKIYGAVSFSTISLGLFIMVFRIKALAQIVGLLTMENGIFLLASSVSGGTPFIVEMAIFFDVFVGVVILGVFVYRINRLFVSIDVSKLNRLRG